MRRAALAAGRKVLGITPAVREALQAYSWPGNIRQLEWAMERAVVLGETERIELRDLPAEVLQPVPEAVGMSSATLPSPNGSLQPVIPEPTWEDHERAKILEALQRTNWNITRAAQLLGMTFRTLQYRLEKFGIKRP